MKAPRKVHKPIFVQERTSPPWRKAEVYQTKHPPGRFQLWKLTCAWDPYDDLDYTMSETVLFDTLESATVAAKKFVETVD